MNQKIHFTELIQRKCNSQSKQKLLFSSILLKIYKPPLRKIHYQTESNFHE